jgi:DNA polymerase-4
VSASREQQALDILHVDLDCFYVSVERKRDPSLNGKPVIVGGAGGRGVVLSCSYETRPSGVRSGIPAMRARRLCPEAIFVAPDFASYTEASKGFRAVLDSFTPKVEPISLDEAFCDVSGAHTLYGTSEDIANAIRARVRSELGIDASVGGGPTKLVAKIASRKSKPDGVLLVDDPVAFLHPLPIEELWGVGEKTATVLRAMGITTIGDLANMPRSVLKQKVGPASSHHLHAVSWGRDPSPVHERERSKSVGAEETFERDLDDDDELAGEILRLSDRVASRLVDAELRARTITVKIRLADFQTFTRSTTLEVPTSDAWTIFQTARSSFTAFRRGRRSVRLLGVTASQIVEGPLPEQLTLDPKPRYAEAEEALTRVRERFGRSAVRFAKLLREDRSDRT